jgi:guanosine-3',5'-bis(diphosphate) 3'-pyrophosphohydrolase
MECTDNKKLGKVERKKIQISKALSVSSEAKLVKMSDKISNCMDLLIKPPIGWNKDRIDGYIVWNYAVSKNLKGVNENLDKKIDKILIDVGMNPNLNENDVNNKLEEYYQILTSCKK